jgi:hypothetical protein
MSDSVSLTVAVPDSSAASNDSYFSRASLQVVHGTTIVQQLYMVGGGNADDVETARNGRVTPPGND